MKAESYFRQSTELVIRRSRRDAGSGGVLAGKTEAERAASRFRGLIRTSYSLAATDGASEPAIARRMFKTAQWAQSSDAAQSLAQMAARQTKGDGLAHLVRERQDLVAEWRAKDRLLIAARAEQAARRSADAEARLGERLVVIDARLAEFDRSVKEIQSKITAGRG